MKTRILFWFFALLFLVLLAANLYHFFTLPREANFVVRPYATINTVKDVPVIRDWEIVERRVLKLDIDWNRDVTGWRISGEDRSPWEVDSPSPILHLDEEADREFRTFTLTPLPPGIGKDFRVTVRMTPTEHYRSQGRKAGDVYNVRADIPCGDFEHFSLEEWCDDYGYLDATSLHKADSLVRVAGIEESDSTLVKMEKLVAFLRAELKDARGVPSNDSRWKTPWKLFVDMRDGRDKGWCTQHAIIYTFFANRAGIPTRYVFGARAHNNQIVYTGHSWAESFIEEQNRWAFIDVDFALLAVFNKRGEVLNTAELFHLNQQDAFDNITARVYIDHRWQDLEDIAVRDTVLVLPFSRVNGVIKRQFIEQAVFQYRRAPHVEDLRYNYAHLLKNRTFCLENLKRYLFKPQLAYSHYPAGGEERYSKRRLLFAGLLISLIGLVILWPLHRRSSKA
jgi:hypothetical protein